MPARRFWAFHLADMVNSDASPWIGMIQQAVSDGDIEDARERMIEIAAQ